MKKIYIPAFAGYEEKFRRGAILIAISGLSGSGKGTQAKLLQGNLKACMGIELKIFESGEFFRALAKEYGFSRIEEFSNYVKSSPALTKEIDMKIDRMTIERALKEDGIYVGRLSFACIGDFGYKIFLNADPKVIAERIIRDTSREEYGMALESAEHAIKARDAADIERYRTLYGIDYKKLSKKCDLIIDTSNKTKEEVAELIYKNVAEWLKMKHAQKT